MPTQTGRVGGFEGDAAEGGSVAVHGGIREAFQGDVLCDISPIGRSAGRSSTCTRSGASVARCSVLGAPIAGFGGLGTAQLKNGFFGAVA
jgi:hypothetical protein